MFLDNAINEICGSRYEEKNSLIISYILNFIRSTIKEYSSLSDKTDDLQTNSMRPIRNFTIIEWETQLGDSLKLELEKNKLHLGIQKAESVSHLESTCLLELNVYSSQLKTDFFRKFAGNLRESNEITHNTAESRDKTYDFLIFSKKVHRIYHISEECSQTFSESFIISSESQPDLEAQTLDDFESILAQTNVAEESNPHNYRAHHLDGRNLSCSFSTDHGEWVKLCSPHDPSRHTLKNSKNLSHGHLFIDGIDSFISHYLTKHSSRSRSNTKFTRVQDTKILLKCHQLAQCGAKVIISVNNSLRTPTLEYKNNLEKRQEFKDDFFHASVEYRNSSSEWRFAPQRILWVGETNFNENQDTTPNATVAFIKF